MPPTRRRNERGFALFIVVAVLALMSVLVADFVALAHSQARATRNMVELARARESAEAGIALALADLLDPDPATRTISDGRLRTVSFADARIELAVQDEAGKIDLNWAPTELISGLMTALDIPGDIGDRILGAVAERRAAIALPAFGPGDIAASALLGGPTLEKLSDMPFRSIADLQRLAKIDGATFARIGPAITVYSQSRRVNPYTAPLVVLKAIPGISAKMAEDIVATRAGSDQASSPINGGSYVASGELRAATITADALTPTGVRFTRAAVVSFTGLPQTPVRYLEWRQPVP